ncbi:MAG: B12-binding domain-containing radical SAM protein [Phycisphaerales bacterium]|nr:MAG: B12-binding domain-containing radical SAM protein [Phycisphaerales bacterium]
MIHAEPRARARIRFINPNCPLSTVTMPGLIRHMTFSRKGIFMPVGVAVCAAAVPDDWTVEIVDECISETPHQPKGDVDVVGISAMTTQARRAYALADAYRRLGVTVLMGGIHPSVMPDEALGHCDAVCIGDGETCLPRMLGDWQRGRLKARYDWVDYPAAPIGTPRKDLLDPADYLVFNPIQTTRGCPHNCSFCTTPGVFGRKFRQRAIPDIIDEVCEAKERFRTRVFIFSDDDFAGNHGWAIELCAALEPLKVRWASQCDILISNNDKLLSAMQRSGCLGLILGLESPDPATLAEAGKRYVDPGTYAWRIRKIRSYNISLWGAFIFGFDTDDWRACMETTRFAQRADLSMSCFPILTPYPGTGLWNTYRRQGRILSEDWDRYNGASVVYRPKRMTPDALRHAQMAAFAEFYSFRSCSRRLGVWPLKKYGWLANLAIWRGIHYYYHRKGRRIPAFSDFAGAGRRGFRLSCQDGEQDSVSVQTTGSGS